LKRLRVMGIDLVFRSTYESYAAFMH